MTISPLLMFLSDLFFNQTIAWATLQKRMAISPWCVLLLKKYIFSFRHKVEGRKDRHKVMSFIKLISPKHLTEFVCPVIDINYYCNGKREKPLKENKRKTFDGGLK